MFKLHRSRFKGRTSPVHFFWGSFDLANTRFSGQRADPPPGADRIFRLSEDAEQICSGFWPGSARFPRAAFFSYTYHKPKGIEQATIEPSDAGWDSELGEFALPYDAVRTSSSPEDAILQCLESTYSAGARLSRRDRSLVG